MNLLGLIVSGFGLRALGTWLEVLIASPHGLGIRARKDTLEPTGSLLPTL